ncbi:putative 2-aminoethylphosphonate ABC transporter permease subunit [Rhodovulum euryhalinum]|uniref:Iron(III) transport system permease protein n=1 Tax=Rhodovulum euryhalinum TaxID=35805 RepID=A0A4R2KV46_9RHOB|nr:putative 2-aminoethylphosphonate ABC transporter permease subunit [Rhodovulum euryhalinum]TCO74068.1 iron(III) transport system permease protein [Rhodovulum euryhalinum]
MTDAATLPPGRTTRLKLDRDGVIKRGLMLVIAAYLFAALALPLYAMLSKSFVTYSFDLTRYEFQVSDETGTIWSDPVSAADLNARLDLFDPDDLRTSTNGRLAVTGFFPEFSFRSPVKYRLRGTVADAPYLVGLDLQNSTEWREFDGNTFRRVNLRPVATAGLQNYRAYFTNPTLLSSIGNSVFIATVSTVLTVTAAFGFAYALNRSCMQFKGAFRLIAMMPILVPSLLPGIALIYLFGNQGLLKSLLMGQSIYGPLGIVIGSIFFTFPHALIIISTALSISDQRQYEAAESLRASKWRTFWTVTIPSARYGLISAAFVTFTLVITDFGLPKVIGGQYNVLAIDIYKQVIGQQNFEMGAVVSVVLLIPAVIAFAVDRIVQKKQVSLLSARSVPYQPRPNRRFDMAMLGWCSLVALFIVGIIGICQFAALVKFWPYDLSFSLRNYEFDRMDGGGWAAYFNSLRMAALTAVVGTVIVFTGAYVVEKIDGFRLGRAGFQFLAMLPMAIPGMVLGLAYIFFFNDPENPLNFVYGTMAILVISTVTHFYTVGHLTALTALKQIDAEFEPVASSLRAPFWRLFARVTVPVCLPSILDISIYLFVNAMTTVSAVVFLYSTHTALASVAVLNMDDAGDVAPAAAMGMMIFYTNAAARMLHAAASRGLLRRTQAWRLR